MGSYPLSNNGNGQPISKENYMTRKWVTHSVPATVLAKEMEFNRDNWLTAFDQIFDETFKGFYPELHKTCGIEPFAKSSYPKVNVISSDSVIEIEAEIAGYAKDDISVQVEENILSIVGKTSQLSENTDKSVYLLRELKRSSFSRSFKLSDQLDVDNIDASFKDGLLKLVIPRKKPTVSEGKVNRIQIK
jgi:HSP20 family protein